MPILLPKGTKEFLVAVIVDKLGNLANLDDVDATFFVRSKAGAIVIDEISAETVTGEMTVLCLIDTTTMEEGNYGLFVRFQVYPQEPLLGPLKFEVESYSNDADS